MVPEGAHVGEPMRVRPWQADIIRAIYDTPTRRAIVSLGRKNGKTALTAMLILAHLVGPEARRNGHIFSAAQSRDQAAIVFDLAAKMARLSPDLAEHVIVRDTAKQLVSPLTGVTYRALSADATTAYGLSPSLVIHDELGQVVGPRSALYDALETASGAQVDPLSIIISTQAATDADLLSTLIDDASGKHDPKTKLFLFAADPKDELADEATWRKANPALGDFRSLEEFREAADRAQRLPAFEAAFRNLYLNQRVAAEAHFLTPSVWESCARKPDPALLRHAKLSAGLDLSGTTDLTALVLTATDAKGDVHIWPYFWAPADGLRERSQADRVPYDLWARDGLLTLTPGASIDYAWVAARIAQLAADYRIERIRFDRWRIADLKRELDRAGCRVPLEEHGQGYRDMAPALDRLEGLALNGRLRHGNHPILTWCAANAVATMDPAGNRKLDKAKATGRIDGLVALAMALSGPKSDAPSFPYHERGIRTLDLRASL